MAIFGKNKMKTISLLSLLSVVLMAIACGGGGGASTPAVKVVSTTAPESTKGMLKGSVGYNDYEAGESKNLKVTISSTDSSEVAFTDSDGNFQVELDEGNYSVEITGSHVVATKKKVDIIRNKLEDVDFVLEATGDITGQIKLDQATLNISVADLDNMGPPVVSLLGTQYSGATNLDGTYRFTDVPVGTYGLHVSFPGTFSFYKEVIIEQGLNAHGASSLDSFGTFYIQADLSEAIPEGFHGNDYYSYDFHINNSDKTYYENNHNDRTNLIPGVVYKNGGVGHKFDDGESRVVIKFYLSTPVLISSLTAGLKVTAPDGTAVSIDTFTYRYDGGNPTSNQFLIAPNASHTIQQGVYNFKFEGVKDGSGLLVAEGTEYSIQFVNLIESAVFKDEYNYIEMEFNPEIDLSSLVYTMTPDLVSKQVLIRDGGSQAILKGQFAKGTTYTLNITALKGKNGLSFDGLPYTQSISVLPTIINASPSDGATGVSVNQSVQLYFNNGIKRSSVNQNIVVKEKAGSAAVRTLSSSEYTTSWQVYSQNSEVLNISMLKKVNSIYTIELSNMTDLYGNTVANKTVSFSTLVPELQNVRFSESVNSGDGTTGNYGASIVLSFNDKINVGSLSNNSFDFKVNGSALSYTIKSDPYDLSVVYVIPSSLDRNSLYTLKSSSNVQTLDNFNIPLAIDTSFETYDQEVVYTNPYNGDTNVNADQSSDYVNNYVTYHFKYIPNATEKAYIEANLNIETTTAPGSDILHPAKRFIWEGEKLYVDFTLDIDANYVIAFPQNTISSSSTNEFFVTPLQFSTSGTQGTNNNQSQPYLIGSKPELNADGVVAQNEFYIAVNGIAKPGSETFELKIDNSVVNFSDYFDIDYLVTYQNVGNNYNYSWNTIYHLSPKLLKSNKSYDLTMKDPVLAVTREQAKGMLISDYGDRYYYYNPSYFNSNSNYSSGAAYAFDNYGYSWEKKSSHPVLLRFTTEVYRLVFTVGSPNDGIGSDTPVSVVTNLGGQVSLSELTAAFTAAPHSINWVNSGSDKATSHTFNVSPSTYSHLELTPVSGKTVNVYDASTGTTIEGSAVLDNKKVLVIKPDLNPLKVSYASADFKYATLTFNQYVDPTTASDTTNYTITRDDGVVIPVTSVLTETGLAYTTSSSSQSAVRLIVASELSMGNKFTVAATGIKSLGGIQTILTVNNSYTFDGYQGALIGLISSGNYNSSTSNYEFSQYLFFDVAVTTDSHNKISMYNESYEYPSQLMTFSANYLDSNKVIRIDTTGSYSYRFMKIVPGIVNQALGTKVLKKLYSNYNGTNDIGFFQNFTYQSHYNYDITPSKNHFQSSSIAYSSSSSATIRLDGDYPHVYGKFDPSDYSVSQNGVPNAVQSVSESNGYVYLTLSTNITTNTSLTVSSSNVFTSQYEHYNFDKSMLDVMPPIGIKTITDYSLSTY